MSGLAAAGAAWSEAGPVRPANEDRVLVLDRAGRGAGLYAVADGLGGHAAGGVASELCVEILRARVPALLAGGVPPQQALVRARQSVFRQYADHFKQRRPDFIVQIF